jgi:hypothetical protein
MNCDFYNENHRRAEPLKPTPEMEMEMTVNPGADASVQETTFANLPKPPLFAMRMRP